MSQRTGGVKRVGPLDLYVIISHICSRIWRHEQNWYFESNHIVHVILEQCSNISRKAMPIQNAHPQLGLNTAYDFALFLCYIHMSQHQNHRRATFWNWGHKLTSFFGCFVGAPWWLYVWVLAPCHPFVSCRPNDCCAWLSLLSWAFAIMEPMKGVAAGLGPWNAPKRPRSLAMARWPTAGGKLPPRLKQRDRGTCAKRGAPPRTHAAIDAFDNTEIKSCHIMATISDTALNPSNLPPPAN